MIKKKNTWVYVLICLIIVVGTFTFLEAHSALKKNKVNKEESIMDTEETTNNDDFTSLIEADTVSDYTISIAYRYNEEGNYTGYVLSKVYSDYTADELFSNPHYIKYLGEYDNKVFFEYDVYSYVYSENNEYKVFTETPDEEYWDKDGIDFKGKIIYYTYLAYIDLNDKNLETKNIFQFPLEQTHTDCFSTSDSCYSSIETDEYYFDTDSNILKFNISIWGETNDAVKYLYKIYKLNLNDLNQKEFDSLEYENIDVPEKFKEQYVENSYNDANYFIDFKNNYKYYLYEDTDNKRVGYKIYDENDNYMHEIYYTYNTYSFTPDCNKVGDEYFACTGDNAVIFKGSELKNENFVYYESDSYVKSIMYYKEKFYFLEDDNKIFTLDSDKNQKYFTINGTDELDEIYNDDSLFFGYLNVSVSDGIYHYLSRYVYKNEIIDTSDITLNLKNKDGTQENVILRRTF